MKKSLYFLSVVIAGFSCFFGTPEVRAQSAASKTLPASTIFFAPSLQTVLEGTTFDVSIYLNTNGASINTMDLTVMFPPDKLTLVKPSSGESLIQLWLQPPVYSNVDGTIHFVGVIPNGVKTKGGLVTTLTFTALTSGEAVVRIAPSTRLLANDGLGTDVRVELGRAAYAIAPQPPGGPVVFSDTHPFSSTWYNNNNVTVSWDREAEGMDFSSILDTIPTTVPANTTTASDTQRVFENIGDGLWYFHVKARKQGMWGGATHFPVRIDTHPPASFKPTVDFLRDSYDKATPREALISFFTTDDLSGVDHYEIAVMDFANAKSVSPVFIQTESPYTLFATTSDKFHVIVRAIDKAGNVRDESMDVIFPTSIGLLFRQNLQSILAWGFGGLIALFLFHYLIGHHIIRQIRRILALLRADREKLEQREAQLEQKEELNVEPKKEENKETPKSQ